MEFLHEHGDSIEADLLRWYQIDLQRDLGTERLTWRRLAALIGQLPREAATTLSVHGDVVRWGAVEHLLASVVDLLAAGNWQRGGKKHAPRPKPVRRPGIERDGERKFGTARSVREMRRLLRKWTRGRG